MTLKDFNTIVSNVDEALDTFHACGLQTGNDATSVTIIKDFLKWSSENHNSHNAEDFLCEQSYCFLEPEQIKEVFEHMMGAKVYNSIEDLINQKRKDLPTNEFFKILRQWENRKNEDFYDDEKVYYDIIDKTVRGYDTNDADEFIREDLSQIAQTYSCVSELADTLRECFCDDFYDFQKILENLDE